MTASDLLTNSPFGWLASWTLWLVLARVSGLLAVAPVFGTRAVPLRIRAGLAVLITLLLAPLQSVGPSSVADPWLGGAGLLREAMIGMCFGLSVRLLVAGAQASGQLLSQLSGLALADTLSPGGDGEAAPLASLTHWVALTIYLAIGGHRQLLAALLDSFETLPVRAGTLGGMVEETAWQARLLDTLVGLTAQSFELAIRATAPGLLAVLTATLVIGLIGRLMPQLNVLALKSSVNLVLAVVLLAAGLGSFGWLVPDLVRGSLDQVRDATSVREETRDGPTASLGD